MAKKIAQLVQDWLGDELVKWEATTDVVEWARAYGTDVERAWTECPRADYLMAIAGACKAPPERVVGVACAAAREALTLVPAKLGLPRKAVYMAEGIRPGGLEPPEASPLSDQTMTLVRELVRDADRLSKAVQAAVPGAKEALVRAGSRLLSDPAYSGRHGGVVADAHVQEALLASTEAVVEATLAERAVVKLRKRTETLYRALASAHGARAAAASLTVATSYQIEAKSLMLVGALVRQGHGTDDALVGVHKAAIIAARSGARVFSEAALVFEHAAGAFGNVAAADERTFRTAILGTLTAMLRGVGAGKAPDDPRDKGKFHAILDAHGGRARLTKLCDYAERVRADIPFSSLRAPQDAADRAALMEKSPRDALLRALEELTPFARLLGQRETVDALETACAVLRAIGKLNKKALAPVLRTVHERMAAAFHTRARETQGVEREEACEAAAEAEAAMREIEAALATLGEEPS